MADIVIPNNTLREQARWYPLVDHQTQLAMIKDNVRFKCVPAGRRSGKTERFKRFMVKTCVNNPNRKYFISAPTSAQVAKIYWDDMRLLSFESLLKHKPNKTDKIIYYNNGTELHLVSLDKPDRIEGINWDGGGIDEFASTKDSAWANLSPLFDTIRPDRPNELPWCWFLGVPDGLNHYYDLCQNHLTLDDWKTYTWYSSDILPDHIIKAARSRMSAKQFRVEYEASFEGVSGRIYDDYNEENHTDSVILPHEQICYTCDFNYTPNSHAICVIRKDKEGRDCVYCLDNIVIDSATGVHNALEFVEKYKNHVNKSLRLYGDPNGKNGEKHGLSSQYLAMEEVFTNHGWKVDRRVANSTLSVRDGQNSVRAMICTADGVRRLFINPSLAEWAHKGLATVQTMKGSTYLEDEKNKYQHITTALRYFIHYEYPIVDIGIDTSMIQMW